MLTDMRTKKVTYFLWKESTTQAYEETSAFFRSHGFVVWGKMINLPWAEEYSARGFEELLLTVKMTQHGSLRLRRRRLRIDLNKIESSPVIIWWGSVNRGKTHDTNSNLVFKLIAFSPTFREPIRVPPVKLGGTEASDSFMRTEASEVRSCHFPVKRRSRTFLILKLLVIGSMADLFFPRRS